MNWLAFFIFLFGMPLLTLISIWFVGLLASNTKYFFAFVAILFVCVAVVIGMNV